MEASTPILVKGNGWGKCEVQDMHETGEEWQGIKKKSE